MIKTLTTASIKFFAIAGLVIVMTGCGGNNKSLANGLGSAAGAATSGIVCWVLGNC